MHRELPPDYSVRPPATADAEAIWRFVAALNEAVLGFADVTLDEVLDQIQEAAFDPATDGWLVHGADGVVAGYGLACRKGDSDEIDVDAIADDDAVADWLWHRATERAAAIGVELGHDEVKLDVGIYRADEKQRGRAAMLGFSPGTTFYRMRIDHDGPRATPAVPDGVVIRFGDDMRVRRDAHDIINAANEGQYGFVALPFEEWHDNVDALSTTDWSQLRVADLDGVPVAMLRGSNQFVTEERCGYISRVAVLESARGRGLAKLLLHQAFAADAANGRAGTILHVDTNNPTPALGLYESVGMRPVLVIDMWRRRIPPTAS